MQTEDDVTAENLKALRESQHKSLKEFWGEVLVSKSAGSLYESGKRRILPLLKRVCYLHFVKGIRFAPVAAKKPKKKLGVRHG